MVLGDMTDGGRNEYRRRSGRWWRLAVARSNRVLESIHMNLRSSGSPNIDISRLAVHNRNIISDPVRCIDSASGATRRDMRDLAILQNAIAITDHYRHMFVLYAQQRINQLLANAQANAHPVRQSRSLRHHRKIRLTKNYTNKRRRRQRRKKVKVPNYPKP